MYNSGPSRSAPINDRLRRTTGASSAARRTGLMSPSSDPSPERGSSTSKARNGDVMRIFSLYDERSSSGRTVPPEDRFPHRSHIITDDQIPRVIRNNISPELLKLAKRLEREREDHDGAGDRSSEQSFNSVASTSRALTSSPALSGSSTLDSGGGLRHPRSSEIPLDRNDIYSPGPTSSLDSSMLSAVSAPSALPIELSAKGRARAGPLPPAAHSPRGFTSMSSKETERSSPRTAYSTEEDLTRSGETGTPSSEPGSQEKLGREALSTTVAARNNGAAHQQPPATRSLPFTSTTAREDRLPPRGAGASRPGGVFSTSSGGGDGPPRNVNFRERGGSSSSTPVPSIPSSPGGGSASQSKVTEILLRSQGGERGALSEDEPWAASGLEGDLDSGEDAGKGPSISTVSGAAGEKLARELRARHRVDKGWNRHTRPPLRQATSEEEENGLLPTVGGASEEEVVPGEEPQRRALEQEKRPEENRTSTGSSGVSKSSSSSSLQRLQAQGRPPGPPKGKKKRKK